MTQSPQEKLDGNKDRIFFLPEGDGYAYNTSNMGNYLWGATGRALGFDKSSLKTAAYLKRLELLWTTVRFRR